MQTAGIIIMDQDPFAVTETIVILNTCCTGLIHKLSLLSFIQQLLFIIIEIVFSLLKVIKPVFAVLLFCLLAMALLQWIKCLPSTHH